MGTEQSSDEGRTFLNRKISGDSYAVGTDNDNAKRL
jgi:hypothetical protein